MTTAEDARTLSFYWEENRDVTRWCGFEAWQQANPKEAAELERLTSDLEWAKKRISLFFEAMERDDEEADR